MSIPLRLVSETDMTVVLGWDPVPGAQGYRFSSSDSVKRSHTWDPARSQVRFAKGADWYRVEALGVVAEGEWPVDAAQPEPFALIPTYRITQPKDAIAYWLYAKSPTTRVVGTDGNGFRSRVVVWDIAGGESEARYSGRDMYMLMGMRLVDGYPGRTGNLHTSPDDDPYGWLPPDKEGGEGTGVSPVAVDVWPTTSPTRTLDGLMVVTQPNAASGNGTGPIHWPLMSRAQMDALDHAWVWLWLHVRWGRRDTGPGAGAIRAWIAGDDKPRIDEDGINTHWWGQHQVAFLQGGYWSSGTPGYTVEHALTRFGRTPRECFEDVPVLVSAAGQTKTGGPSPGSHSLIEPRRADEAAVPAALRWTA